MTQKVTKYPRKNATKNDKKTGRLLRPTRAAYSSHHSKMERPRPKKQMMEERTCLPAEIKCQECGSTGNRSVMMITSRASSSSVTYLLPPSAAQNEKYNASRSCTISIGLVHSLSRTKGIQKNGPQNFDSFLTKTKTAWI